MINLFREIRELIISLTHQTTYIFNNQWNLLRNIYSSHKMLSFLRRRITDFLKWVKIYRSFLLIINILAFLNLLFSIFIIVSFSNLVEWEELFPITFITGIFIKFAPVFFQELLFTYYFTITSFIKSKIREIIINIISSDKLTQISPGIQNIDSNYLANSIYPLANEPFAHGEDIKELSSLEDNGEKRRKDDNTYLYWALVILGVCTIAGLSYWYFYGEIFPKGGSGQRPGGEDQTMPGEWINSPNSETMEGVKSKIVKEIEYTTNLTDKFRFWNLLKNEKPSDQLSIIASSPNSPIIENTIGDIPSISGSTTPTPGSISSRPRFELVTLREIRPEDEYYKSLVNFKEKKTYDYGFSLSDKGVQTNSTVEIRIEKGIQTGNISPIIAESDVVSSNTSSYGTPLNINTDWTMYPKKDEGVQTSPVINIGESIPSSPNIISPTVSTSSENLGEITSGVEPGVIRRPSVLTIDPNIKINILSAGNTPIDSTIERSHLRGTMPGEFNLSSPEDKIIELPVSDIPTDIRSAHSFATKTGSEGVLPQDSPSNMGINPRYEGGSSIESLPVIEENISIPSMEPLRVPANEPLRVIPQFGLEGISKLPLPESGSTSIEDVRDPFSDTPILTPEQSLTPQSPKD